MPAPDIQALIDEAVLAERERIAQALEHEASGCSAGCAEDDAVMREAAWLVRANFSYDEAERLQIAADHRAAAPS